MRMRWKAALPVVLAGLAACSSSAEIDDFSAPSGQWRWVESVGGIAGTRITPAAGYEIRLRFDDGLVEAFRNDTLKTRTRYQVRRGSGSQGSDRIEYDAPLRVFPFDTEIEVQEMILAPGDTLVLADECCDRYSHRLVRR